MIANLNVSYFLYENRRKIASAWLVILAMYLILLLLFKNFWPSNIKKSDTSMVIEMANSNFYQPKKQAKSEVADVNKPIDKVISTSVKPIVSESETSVPAKQIGSDTKTQELMSSHSKTVVASYESSIKEAIEHKKNYPTGRQAMLERPIGTVFICVLISRAGKFLESTLKSSSGSILLDGAARRLVSGVVYPPFPDSFMSGKDRNEFCVRLKYEFPN